MNLQQLYYFQAVAENQQYTLAAERLHVTQATLSYAISNLERELNVRLFDRRGKRIILTECGKAYLACVRDALHALDRGEQMVKNLAYPAKTIIKLSYLESLKQLIPNLISDICSSHPDAQLRFDLAHYTAPIIEQKLIRREADIAISSAPKTQEISSHLIGYQDNVLIVPKQHPWANLEAVPLYALDGQPFIAYSQECAIRGYYDSILEAAHIKPEIFAEARFDSNILDMVSYNLGVALVPRMKRLERYDLMAVPIRDEIPPRAIYLLWAKNAALLPQIDDFRQHIIESADLSRYL